MEKVRLLTEPGDMKEVLITLNTVLRRDDWCFGFQQFIDLINQA